MDILVVRVGQKSKLNSMYRAFASEAASGCARDAVVECLHRYPTLISFYYEACVADISR